MIRRLALSALVSAVAVTACSKKKSKSEPDAEPTSNGGVNGTDDTGNGTATAGTLYVSGSLGSGYGLYGASLTASATPDKVFGVRLYDHTLDRMQDGIVKSVDIAEDGSFKLAFAESTDSYADERDDWVFLLVDSKAANGRDGIVGQLNVADGNDGLMKLPLKDVKSDVEEPAAVDGDNGAKLADDGDETAVETSLDLGTVSAEGGDAVTSKTVTETAESFDLSADDMKQMAKTDNAVRNVGNFYANYKATGGADGKPLYFIGLPNFSWTGAFADIKNQWSDPDDFAPAAYSINISSNEPTMTYAKFCEGGATPATLIELTTPVAIYNKNNVAMVLKNTGTPHEDPSLADGNGRSGTCYYTDSLMYGERRPGGTLESWEVNFNDGKMATNANGDTVGIPEGIWRLKINNTEVANFDFATANPYDANGKPTIYIPAMNVEVDATTSKIKKIGVKWFYWDRDANRYQEVTDTTVLRKTVGGLQLYWTAFDWPTSGQRSEEHFAFENGFETTTFEKDWYYPPTTQDATHPVPGRITAGYQIGGVAYSWTWQP